LLLFGVALGQQVPDLTAERGNAVSGVPTSSAGSVKVLSSKIGDAVGVLLGACAQLRVVRHLGRLSEAVLIVVRSSAHADISGGGLRPPATCGERIRCI
jgi:hypothetical protein